MAGETVLLVDDEPLVRGLVRAILEDNGYMVIEATDGRHALEQARTHPGPIDLVLTDVLMPHMRGTELAPLFLARRPGVPILYMSASLGDVPIRPEPLIEKPFTLDGLARAVRTALARPKAA